jgi:hypothetical protein
MFTFGGGWFCLETAKGKPNVLGEGGRGPTRSNAVNTSSGEIQRLRQLEDDNRRLKQMVADLSLNKR